MEILKRLEPLALLLLIVGGINWAVITLFDVNMLTEAFGTGAGQDVAYCVIGFCAVMFVPRLVESLRVDMRSHGMHPRGT